MVQQQQQQPLQVSSSPREERRTQTTGDRGNAARSEGVAATTGADPRDFTNGLGNTTTHAPIDGLDAVNAPPSSVPATVAGEKEVRIKHDSADPLRIAATPTEDALYEARSSTGECEGAWSLIDNQVGTVAAPLRTVVPTEDCLYIGGAPTINDIHQGGLADCYFLASIGSIIQSDPGQISGMMSLSGGSAQVSFFRYNTATAAWIPCAVSVTNDLARHTDGAGTNLGLVAAGYRIAEQPSLSEWSADVQGTELWVSELAHHDVALWAPLLEKAYARYVERWGQYGGFQPGSANAGTDSAGNARSGYEVINGGIAHFTYPIVYGPDALAFNQTNMAYTPGTDGVAANLPAIQNLLRLSGDGVPPGQAFNMTVGIGRDTAVNRLDAQLQHTLAQPYMRRYAASFSRHLTSCRTKISDWQNAAAADQPAALTALSNACASLMAPGNWPVLDSDRESGDFRDLSELLLVVRNIATDASSGQRSTYAWHSYTVQGSSFADSTGAPLTVTLANLATTSAQIDATKSQVNLRNPHGTNEPDQDLSGPADGQDDGSFQMNLEQFFRAFSFQQTGLVRT